MLPDETNVVLRIAAAIGIPPAIIDSTAVRLGEPIAGIVALTGQPHLGQEIRPQSGGSGYHTGAFVSVPVLLTGNRVGVLNVADPLADQGFGYSDLRALQEFSAYVALAIDRATLRQEVIRAREDERQRVARELHDEAGQALTAAVFRLDLDAMRLADNPATARAAIEHARSALTESARLLHDVAYALRPRILDDLGLDAALRSLASRTEEIGLVVSLAIEGDVERLDETREVAIFRVAQEALTNVRRHARARQTWVRLVIGATSLTLTVEDDGVGQTATASGITRGNALGVLGMRERVEALGGRFEIGARSGGGTRITAMIPLPPG